MSISGVLAYPVSNISALPVSGFLALPVSGILALPVSGVFGLPVSRVSGLSDVEGLSAAEFKKQQLDKWLHCCFCSGLNILWYENILNNLYNDLVKYLGVFGGYFYTHIYVWKTHRP